jgi:hypothetical protein
VVIVVPLASRTAIVIVAVTRRTTVEFTLEESSFTRGTIVARAFTVAWRWTFWSAEPAARTFAVTRRPRRAIGNAETSASAIFTLTETWTIALAEARALVWAAAFETFKPLTQWTSSWRRTIVTASWRRRHVLVYVFGKFLEFVFAQLVVVVLIELGEQLLRLRHSWWRSRRNIAMTFGPAPRFIAAVFTVTAFVMSTIIVPSILAPALVAAALIISPAFAALTGPAGMKLSHFLAGLFPLVFIQFAVAVLIELFYDFLAHLRATVAVALLVILVVSDGRRTHQPDRQEYETQKQVPHVERLTSRV